MKKLILLLTVIAHFTSYSQKLSNKLSFQAGQKLQMLEQAKSTSDFGMGSTEISCTLTRLFDVQGTSDTATTIEHKIKRLQAAFDMAGAGDQTIDTDDEKTMRSNTGKSLDKLLKNKYTMSLSPSGMVTKVTADDPNAMAKLDNQTQMLMSFLTQLVNGTAIPSAGSRTDFAILPKFEVGKGDTWTDTAGYRKTVYLVTDLNDAEMKLSFVEENKLSNDQSFGPVTATVNLNEKSNGKLVLDRKTGLLKEKASTTNSDGTISVMGNTSPVTMKTTRTWTVTRL